mgnify:CR=1 FL=1
MKRIDVHYGGALYSIGEKSFDDFAAEVTAILAAGHGWITVNDGEGAPRPAHLLISPGVPIALIPIPDESAPEAEVAAEGHFIP